MCVGLTTCLGCSGLCHWNMTSTTMSKQFSFWMIPIRLSTAFILVYLVSHVIYMVCYLSQKVNSEIKFSDNQITLGELWRWDNVYSTGVCRPQWDADQAFQPIDCQGTLRVKGAKISVLVKCPCKRWRVTYLEHSESQVWVCFLIGFWAAFLHWFCVSVLQLEGTLLYNNIIYILPNVSFSFLLLL